MTYDLLIQGGRVIDPAESRDATGDVAISKGRIASVADHIPAASAVRVVDAARMGLERSGTASAGRIRRRRSSCSIAPANAAHPVQRAMCAWTSSRQISASSDQSTPSMVVEYSTVIRTATHGRASIC